MNVWIDRTRSGCLLLLVLTLAQPAPADDSTADTVFKSQIQPLLQNYCWDCHAEDNVEAELDLSRFTTVQDVRAATSTWLKIRHVLETRQMPPKDSGQPREAEFRLLQSWVRSVLREEAMAHAGDPGPVILRRLNNEEYTYTVQDLTGVASLSPTREFPVDGAAGEGFINSGSAQAMSPALVQKYFDAAREVADHLVLLPDGITFSAHTTRRDQTDEILNRLRAFYDQFTDQGGGQPINIQGVDYDTNHGGLLPLRKYLLATLEERAALTTGTKSIADVAEQRGLNEKYLTSLWAMLTAKDDHSSLLNGVRRLWRQTEPSGVDDLWKSITAVQSTLWKFNPVGHIGDDGQPRTWLEPANPLITRRNFRIPLADDQSDVTVFLTAATTSRDKEAGRVVWEQPRLVGRGADIPISHLPGLLKEIEQTQHRELNRTTAYLAAAAEVISDVSLSAHLEDLAQRHQVHPEVLGDWLAYLAIGDADAVTPTGNFTEQHTSPAYSFISGWGTMDTPFVVSNASDDQVRIPGVAAPGSVLVHPSPALFAAVGWQSPLTGTIRVEAHVSDAHPECGNGQEWILEHRTGTRSGQLDTGDIGTGGSIASPAQTVRVRKGDLISLIVGPKNGSHSCDLTNINLVLNEVGGAQRRWDLAKDVSSDIQAANPHADRQGNATIWHFYHGKMTDLPAHGPSPHSVPADSLADRWRTEQTPAMRQRLAEKIQALVTGVPPAATTPDGVLYSQVRELVSPVSRLELPENLETDPRFRGSDGIASSDLVVSSSGVVELRIPAVLARGRTFVVDGRLVADSTKHSGVRLEASTSSLAPDQISVNSPIVVADSEDAKESMTADFDDFRALFAPALCYARVVPVDEVVTITLFYRQDDLLQKFMLDEEQTAELQQLWNELLYVSREPLQYQVAFEQNRAFATQDRADLVEKWAPLTNAVNHRVAEFRQLLVDSQAAHIDGMLDLAERAWRRPLSDSEQSEVREFYAQLRLKELTHEEAIQLALVRLLTSPVFLYRREQPGSEAEAIPVTGEELATRLSYFLWSSLPDETLQETAATGQLLDDDVLTQETQRMLADPRTRRLAVQFACQWLHLRDFDQNDDKNEALYPQFADLRSDMYQETILFFEDMFRNNGSVLGLLNADHTFLNESLARHYGIDGIAGEQWQKVSGVRAHQRGGLLAMATVLSSQSGASRTSPILRGNWISETLLGERLPKPPPNVPQLPEGVPEGLTARQLIERHSSAPECAKCHARIDPYGFALEQYDAIGRLRSGETDTATRLVDGHEIDGLDGLREYLLTVRRADIVRQFCRKLLGFALGRATQLSDEPLLDTMVSELEGNGYRFHAAVRTVVLSPQFRSIRGLLAEEHH